MVRRSDAICSLSLSIRVLEYRAIIIIRDGYAWYGGIRVGIPPYVSCQNPLIAKRDKGYAR